MIAISQAPQVPFGLSLNDPDGVKVLLLKLRWMGLEDEAQLINEKLIVLSNGAFSDPEPHDSH